MRWWRWQRTSFCGSLKDLPRARNSLGATAIGVDQALSQNIQQRTKSAGDKAEVACAVLQERITKATEMANGALTRLELGGSKIAQQHDDFTMRCIT